jgi:hypothetical protein
MPAGHRRNARVAHHGLKPASGNAQFQIDKTPFGEHPDSKSVAKRPKCVGDLHTADQNAPVGAHGH